MGLRFRLLLVSGLFVTLLMGIGWMALSSTNRLHEELLAKHRQTSQAELHAVVAQASFKKQIQEWNNMLKPDNRRADMKRYWDGFQREEAETRGGVARLRDSLPQDSNGMSLAADLLAEHQRLGAGYRATIARMQSGGGELQGGVEDVLHGLDRKATETFDQIVHALSEDRKSMQATMEVLEVRNTALTAVSTAGATVLSFLLLAFWLNRWVTRPVRSVIKQAEQIAAGKFEECEALSSTTEIVQLQRALNAMASSLKDSYEHLETANGELKQARDTALDASRLKSEFLANVSHEMRTPLNGVVGMSELLADTPLNRDQTMMANIMRSSSKTLLAVINDLLDFSKIEADCIELNVIEFRLEEILEESILVVAPRVDATDVALGFVIESGVPPWILGDPVRLKQILTNLLSNAGKFTEKGEISLRVRALAREERGTHLQFLVSDTGIGVPQDKLDVIFEAFRQADGSSTRERSGTGLGLAISKRLVKLMEGEIRVESKMGEGSCFIVDAWFQEVKGQTEQQRDDPSLEGKRILIIDDHAINREILIRQCKSWGCRAVAVTLATEALEIVEQPNGEGEFDLIISDYQMPGMDGHELAQRLKSRPETKDVPIVLLTSVAPGLGMCDAPEDLFEAVATKPVIKRALYEVVAGVLGGTVRAPASDQQERAASTRRKAAGAARVLFAEDDPMNRKYISLLLRKGGFAHDVVENGQEAVNAVEQNSYALILMDCSMPVMDGYEATRKIREITAGGPTPVIIGLTGHTGEDARQKCLAAGMDQYRSKPIEPEELLTELDLLLAVHAS